MKKAISLSLVILVISLMFTALFVNVSAENPSPEASTYTTKYSGGHHIMNPTSPSRPSGEGYTGHSASWSRSYNPSFDYTNNSGKDNPGSPNFTGSMEIKSDRSLNSPDTQAESNNSVVVVTIAVVVMLGVLIGVLAVRGKKINAKEN